MNLKLITLLILLSFASIAQALEKGDRALTRLENGLQIIGSVKGISGDKVYLKAFKNGNKFLLTRNLADTSKLIQKRKLFAKSIKVEFKNIFGEMRTGTIVSKFANGTVEALFYQKEYGRRANELAQPITLFLEAGEFTILK